MLRKICLLIALLGLLPRPAQAQEGIALLHILYGHTSPIEGFRVSPDGSLIVSWDAAFSVRVWEAATGDLITVLPAHRETIEAVNFSPDSRWLMTRSVGEERLFLWELPGGTLAHTLEGHDTWSTFFTPDSAIFFSAGYLEPTPTNRDYGIRAWELATGTLLYELPGQAGYALSPDGSLLATSPEYGYVEMRLWDAHTGAERVVYDFGSNMGLFGPAFTPDGSALVFGWNEQVQVRNLEDGGLIHMVQVNSPRDDGYSPDLAEFLLHPDGITLVTANYASYYSQEPTTLRVWNLATGELIDSIPGVQDFDSYRGQMEFIANGSLLLYYDSGSDQPLSMSQVYLWDTVNFDEQLAVQGKGRYVQDVVISPDSQHMAVVTNDHLIRFWDLSTLEETDQVNVAAHWAAYAGDQLITFADQMLLIYGVPDAAQPALPYVFIPGNVIPSAIHVRSQPSLEAEILGFALRGQVMVGGVDATRTFAYLPQQQGWVTLEYLQIDHPLSLPVLPH